MKAAKSQLKLGDDNKLTTSESVISALRACYPAECYAFIEQVANATGTNVRGWADAVAFGLWPSRGLDVAGIEVKVSRSDWLAELATPAKAENVAQFCDYWYLAVGDASIVRDGELPTTWGLYVPSKKGMKCVKPAEKNPDTKLTRGFLASVMRNLSKPDAKSLSREYDRGRADERKTRRELPEQGVMASQLRHYEILMKTVEQFEKASGIHLGQTYDGANIGKAARIIANGHIDRYRDDAVHLAKQVKRLAEKADEMVEALTFETQVSESPTQEKLL